MTMLFSNLFKTVSPGHAFQCKVLLQGLEGVSIPGVFAMLDHSHPWRIDSQHTHINLPYRALTSVGTARKCCALETNVSNYFFFQNTSLASPLYSTVFPMRQPVQIDPCFHILGVLAPLEEKVNKSHLLFFFFSYYLYFSEVSVALGLLAVGRPPISSMLSRVRSFHLCCSTYA